ncbi:MAG: DUF268 domain-containing protein [Campylobacterales bacterium]
MGKVFKDIKNKIVFKKHLRQFLKQDKRFHFTKKDLYPCLNDNTSDTKFDTHYVYHCAWAARVLKKINPDEHTDIGSHIYFNAITSSFININFYDYRPANILLDGLSSSRADILKLPFETSSIKSLSCMHVVEHIGLGRYGDKIDAEGDLKAISELKRVVAENGDLLFVVPLSGKAKLKFNAHRIYTFEMIIEYFSDLHLHEFALIPDNAYETGLIENPEKSLLEQQRYGCGCFWFKKGESSNVKSR